jgi:hypothetical protein
MKDSFHLDVMPGGNMTFHSGSPTLNILDIDWNTQRLQHPATDHFSRPKVMEITSHRHIAFTVCSNNYLAQAKTLEQSLRTSNPDFIFVIGLADIKTPDVDYAMFETSVIVELNEKIIPGYGDMISRYGIVELNTAVKPFFFRHLMQQYPDCASVFYFDPDIFVYQSLDYLLNLFSTANILLTPHFLTPLPVDTKYPKEFMALNYGIYNLGFIAVKSNSAETSRFLDWWCERTFNYCYYNTCEGLFVDQLWINLAPVYFNGVHIVRHFGCNMGPWNIYERTITKQGDQGETLLQNGEALLFYHFSSFDFKDYLNLSADYNRTSIRDSKQLQAIYKSYGAAVKKNKFEYYKTLSCNLNLVTTHPPLKSRILGPFVSLAREVWKKI